MADLVQVLGEATGASRAYVFENVHGDGNVPLTIRRVLWSATGRAVALDDPRLAQCSRRPTFRAGWS